MPFNNETMFQNAFDDVASTIHLSLGIGAVVAASVIGLTISITSNCEETCSGLPLRVAATRGRAVHVETNFESVLKAPDSRARN
jgi:hypothetical protein